MYLDTNSVPADGASAATVVVVPRDAAGVPLGTGLTLTVDTVALLPGLLAEPVKDRGNGRYALRVVSSQAGTSLVRVAVEGLYLSDSATIQFTAP